MVVTRSSERGQNPAYGRLRIPLFSQRSPALTVRRARDSFPSVSPESRRAVGWVSRNKPGSSSRLQLGLDTVKSRAEVKIVVASFALLMGLVVPVSSALIDANPAVEPAAAALPPSGASLFVHGAPQPLLLMALGALVVLIPVTRRALRAGEPLARRAPAERPLR